MNYNRIFVICCLVIYQFLFLVNCSTSESTTTGTCQVNIDYGNRPRHLSPDEFQTTSCALCYYYITSQSVSLTNTSLSLTKEWNALMDYNNNTYKADPDDESGMVYTNFKYDYTAKQWQKCCRDAVQCCKAMLKPVDKEENSNSCLPGWNFYHCWPHLQLEEKHETSCPDYVYSFYPKSPCKRFVRRTCTGNNTSEVTNLCESLEFHRRPKEGQSPEEVVNPGEKQVCCRNERGYEMSFDAYRQDTCARCYNYVLPAVKSKRFNYVEQWGVLIDMENNNKPVLADVNNEDILGALRGASIKDKWKECCSQAIECCKTMTATANYSYSGPFCPRTWDGWQCFGDTPVNSSAYNFCPDYIYFSHHIAQQCRGNVERKCVAENTWFMKIKGGIMKEHSEYGACTKPQEQKSQEHFLIACYVVSLVALIPALIIFSSYRQLRVPRIYMHSNFFLALTLSCIFSIIYRCVIILPEMEISKESKTPIDGNGPGCKILLVFTRYTRMCTYTWMLCEGFYLQRLITCAFVEQKKLLWFYLVGWGFPLIPITVYAIINKTLADVNCWAIPTDFEWILGSFNLACILVNILFLINIIRVLVTKLKSIQSNEPSHYRKAVRATLILIPVFGTHFIVVTYNGVGSSSSCSAMTFYFYFKDAIDGLQGFGVALIFCYLNGEVISLLRRSYERFKISRGLPSNSVRNRWSMSTQMSNAVEHNKGTPPLSNNRTAEKNHVAASVLNNHTKSSFDSGNSFGLKGFSESNNYSNNNNNNDDINKIAAGKIPKEVDANAHKTVPESITNNIDVNKYNPGATLSKVSDIEDSSIHKTLINANPNEDKTPDAAYENKGFGFDNVVLSKDKVTEL